ncbi:MAG: translocation/assembly module TamB domain-containing protein [Ferruginibacter sp.]
MLQLSSVQTWLLGKIAGNFSEKLHTRVTIQHVGLRFFNKMELSGFMVEDRRHDTLLYAGKARLNLTDWFFLKDKITLKYIGLDNAIINMNRSDSTWNYGFLVDYFSSPSSSTSKKKDIEISLQEVHFNNVRFNKIDKWIGQDMLASMQKMDIWFNAINYNRKEVSIRKIYLDHPSFAQNDYDGLRPEETSMVPVLEKIPVISAFKWNNSGWDILVSNLQLENGIFRNDKYTERKPFTHMFDGMHLYFSGITGNLDNIRMHHDTLRAAVHLMAKEQSGLLVKNLQSNVKFTPELMEFNDLDLQTNRSRLGNYYSMGFKAFNTDFSRFLHNVQLEANFKNSVINSDDIAFFAPEVSSLKKVFFLNGEAKGTVDNFTAHNMSVQAGQTNISGDLSMRGLPDINTTFIDLKASDFQTSYADLVSLAPAIRQVQTPALNKLGNIRFRGNYTGFINDFVTYGTFQTSLGTVTADLNMKLPSGRPPTYSGKLVTANFNLGSFLNTADLGNISMNGQVQGSGFNARDIDIRFKGNVNSVYALGYTYRNAVIDGGFTNNIISGKFSVRDPNLDVPELKGKIDFSGSRPVYDATGVIAHADLKNLGLVDENLRFSGIFNVDFSGRNIDDFLGSARIFNANLLTGNTRLAFDSLSLRSLVNNGSKVLTLQTNELDASLTGTFTLANLPDAFRVFLHRYYPTYIPAPTKRIEDQDFSFIINTRRIEDYIGLIDPRLKGFNNSIISGNLALGSNNLVVKAFVPEFEYDGKIFRKIEFTGNGYRDTLFAHAAIEDIQLNDSLHMPDSRISLTAHEDMSLIELKTSAGNILNDAILNAGIETYADGVRIHFYPSSFVINDRKWELRKDGELTLRKNFIDASDISFVHEEQKIVISSELDEINDNTHLVATLTQVNVEDFLPFIITSPALKGYLTGTAAVRDPFGKTWIEFTGRADSLSIDGQYIGRVNLGSNANLETGLIKFNADANNPGYVFSADGFYNFKDSTTNNLALNFISDSVDLRILKPYLGGIFDDIHGQAKTRLQVHSGKDYPTLTGTAVVHNGSLTVGYTQCRYIIPNHEIKFKNNEIDFGRMPVKDTLGNEGLVSGSIYHHFFRDFSFDDLRFETSRMLLLNTTSKDNSEFYGTVTGNALMTLNGPINNMRMNIDGEPGLEDSSHIFLPTGTVSRDNKKIDYIDFIQFGTEMEDIRRSNDEVNILVNMNLTANPACKIDVILDEETGDIIKGQGNGQLNIRVGTTEPLSIRGRYDLTRGEYTFKFQTFLKKPFTLNSGSITWSGDPYLALIDIDAEYIAKAVNIGDLFTSGQRQKEDLIIISHITGNLLTPNIRFEFELPERSELTRDYLVVKKLAEYQNDENEMYKQVASLLLFNQFISNTQNFLTGNNTLALATNTIGGVVSSWLTNIFNKELERATNGVISSYIDISPTVDLQSRASQLQASVRAGLKILLSSRINVLIGGNLDYNNPYQALDRKGVLTPDITIEWLLNRDGSIRVIGFNRTSIDLTNGQRNRSGVQLSYRKNFNTLSDIFKSRKKLAEEDARRVKGELVN